MCRTHVRPGGTEDLNQGRPNQKQTPTAMIQNGAKVQSPLYTGFLC